MKKILLSVFAVFTFTLATFAQTSEGSVIIESGFSPFSEGLQRGSNTGFALFSVDGTTLWSVGFEGGYFLQDNLAVKAGAGYLDFDGDGSFSYKLGLKYYAAGKVPFQVDITGATVEDTQSFPGFSGENPDPVWLGLQGGYAIFVSDNISFEPTVRYNISLNSDYTEENILEIRMGFAFFIN